MFCSACLISQFHVFLCFHCSPDPPLPCLTLLTTVLTFSVLFDIVCVCVCFSIIFIVTCSEQFHQVDPNLTEGLLILHKHTHGQICVFRFSYETQNLPLNSASVKSNSNLLWQKSMNDSNKRGCYVAFVVWSRVFFNEAPHIPPTPFTELFAAELLHPGNAQRIKNYIFWSGNLFFLLDFPN